MCGICAVVETDRPGQDIAEVLERMHSSLAHRGPDGEGHLWIDGSGNARALNGGAGGGFPTNSYAESNYWVDVLFNPAP